MSILGDTLAIERVGSALHGYAGHIWIRLVRLLILFHGMLRLRREFGGGRHALCCLKVRSLRYKSFGPGSCTIRS